MKWPAGVERPRSDFAASRLPRAVRDMGDPGRLAMHLILSVMEQPAAETRRWWVFGPAEPVKGKNDFELLRMKSYPRLPWHETKAEFLVQDFPTVPGAKAERVVETSAGGGPLWSVSYPTIVRWYSPLLPAEIRKKLKHGED